MKKGILWIAVVAVVAVSVNLALAPAALTARRLTDLEKQTIRGGTDCQTVQNGTFRCDTCTGPDAGSGWYSKCFDGTPERTCQAWHGPGPFIQTCDVLSDYQCPGDATYYTNPQCTTPVMPPQLLPCARSVTNAAGGLKILVSGCP